MLNNDGTVQTFDNDYKGPIMLWPFREAPDFLRKLAPLGGVWLAHVPPWFEKTASALVGMGGQFEKATISRFEIADGSIVLIGHHITA